MPRCFLPKKSSEADATPRQQWDDEDETYVNHRSTIGSISAAQAVASITEPVPHVPNKEIKDEPSDSEAAMAAAILASVRRQNESKQPPVGTVKHEEYKQGTIKERRSCSNKVVPPTSKPGDRIRTKEETDAAHDLLELSRSLPPLTGPQQIHHPAYPPTPPTPDDHHYTTLIYISPNNNNNNVESYPEYPLTPPDLSPDPSSQSSGFESGSFVSSPPPPLPSSPNPDVLTIVDGRTKKTTGGKDRSKYTCTECGKNYATSSNLSRHKQTHRSLDSNNAKKCNICGKMYVSMPALSMHILTHNLSHKCDVCGKAFSRPWLLQGHLRSHTGHKPYACTVCKKSFADRSNLRAHMQTHSPSKNFQCSRCHKTFALKSYLNKHYESSCVRNTNIDAIEIQR